MQRDGERDGSGGDHLAVSATQLQRREDLTRGGDDGDRQDGTDQTRPAVKSTNLSYQLTSRVSKMRRSKNFLDSWSDRLGGNVTCGNLFQ